MSKNKKREVLAFVVAMLSIIEVGVMVILYCMEKINFFSLVVGCIILSVVCCVCIDDEKKTIKRKYDNASVSYSTDNKQTNYEKTSGNNTKQFECGDIVKVGKYGIYGAVISQDDKNVMISSNDGEYVDTFDKNEVEKG